MIRSVITFIVILMMTFFCGVLIILLWPFGSYNLITNNLALIWARTILFFAGTKLEITGLEKVDKKKPYIFVGNHQSHFDVLSAFSVLPQPIRFIAKKELFKFPIFGWAMTAAGTIKVDRSNREKALKSIETAIETIKKGVSIIVFPEGTRSHDGEIHKFKKGAFVMAINGEIPIVPVTISGARYILKKHSMKLKPGKVKIEISDPVDPSLYSYEKRNQFADDVRKIIINKFDSNYNKS